MDGPAHIMDGPFVEVLFTTSKKSLGPKVSCLVFLFHTHFVVNHGIFYLTQDASVITRPVAVRTPVALMAAARFFFLFTHFSMFFLFHFFFSFLIIQPFPYSMEFKI
jgi:hypothetical protein